MTTGKQANQRARYAALAAAHKWLAARMKQPRQCECEQCQMVLKRQAVCNVVYADTDCVVFTQYVPLDCDAKKYGKWKIEAENDDQIYIGKKIYTDMAGTSKHAKGLNRKRLSVEDFQLWYDGKAPTQTQTQKQNFVNVMAGANMFIERTKRGQINTV